MTGSKLPYNLDRDVRSADWLRTRTYDILPATTVTLLGVLDVPDGTATKEEQRQAIQHFMTLPAAQALPEDIRKDLEERGLL